MRMISLTPLDLGIASLLVILLAFTSFRMQLGLSGQILIAAARTTIQLLLVGLVLKTLFANAELGWITLMALAMLGAAGREVMARQKRRLKGLWGFGVGSSSMFVSSFAIAFLALVVVVQADPWYAPQYSITLLGMMLGNTMNGVALSIDRLTQSAWQQRTLIEERLMLGHIPSEAIGEIRQDAMRAGMIPTINAMAAAGLVSLPGMMTGQILAGSPPVEAVKYQILIMFLITAGSGFGTMLAIWMTTRRLFDIRARLRLDRLKTSA